MREKAVALAVAALAAFALSTPSQAKYKVLYSFCSLANCADGSGPNYGLVADADGKLFATTSQGGAYNRGAIFQLSKGKGRWTEKVLYSFCPAAGCKDGQTPQGPLILDTAGNIYGVTAEGGEHSFGNVFELVKGKHGSWSFKVLHAFCSVTEPMCADGRAFPGGLSYLGKESGAPYDGVSPLYGVTAGGGQYDRGTVYSLTQQQPGAWIQDVLYSFCASGDPCRAGAAPFSAVIVRDPSTIVGTAVSGGGKHSDSAQGGVVFELASDGHKWRQSVLYRFCSQTDCADGAFPYGPPMLDASGNLKGTAAYKGIAGSCSDGCGVIYNIAPDGTETTLHQFCSLANCADGTNPQGGLTIDVNGTLYGTTLGLDGPGTLFSYDGTLRVLHTFCSKTDCADGNGPYDVTLLRDAAGNLFGTAREGGANGFFGGGVVFEWTPEE